MYETLTFPTREKSKQKWQNFHYSIFMLLLIENERRVSLYRSKIILCIYFYFFFCRVVVLSFLLHWPMPMSTLSILFVSTFFTSYMLLFCFHFESVCWNGEQASDDFVLFRFHFIWLGKIQYKTDSTENRKRKTNTIDHMISRQHKPFIALLYVYVFQLYNQFRICAAFKYKYE